MPGTNARITQAQLLTDFIHNFLYSVRAIHDRACHSHLRQNNEQLMLLITPTEGSFGRTRGAARREQFGPRDGSPLQCASQNKKLLLSSFWAQPWVVSLRSRHCFTSHFPIMSSMMENLCCFIKISSLPFPLGSFSEGCPVIKNGSEMAQRNCRNLSEQAGL